ncbi:hypothetical protein LOD99_5886 [Oopsacas minuta]|uniref:G-protein coupled receptors family 2 profile 2 domain-containing protein n=1 Tax=Oopsacas minuta TaxID=111878 RepID=A0AAV7JPJ2_9METZ|nr:hypothetical protein LOD99_5886 [Oopsacas minuta]
MTLTSLCFGISFLVGYWYNPGIWCTIQGALLHFLALLQVYWFAVIVVNLYINVVFFKRTTKWLEIVFVCLSPIVPLITCIIPIPFNAYGPAGVWCWISIDPALGLEHTGNILRWSLYYGILTSVLVLIILAYILLIIIMLYKTEKLSCGGVRTRSWSMGEVKKIGILKDIFEHSSTSFLAFPIVCVIVYIFPITNRFLNLIFPYEEFEWLLIIQAFISPLIGFLIVSAYMLDKTFWKNLKYTNMRDQYISWRFKTVVTEYPTNE